MLPLTTKSLLSYLQSHFLKEVTFLLKAGIALHAECSFYKIFSFSRTRPGHLHHSCSPDPDQTSLSLPAPGLGKMLDLELPSLPTLSQTPVGWGRREGSRFRLMVMGTYIATASSSLHQSLDFQSCVKYKLAAQILVYYMSNQLNKQKCQNRLNSEPVPSIYGDKAFFGEVDPLIYL